MRWIGIGLAGVLGLLVLAVVSAKLSVDAERAHSARTRALPLWSGPAESNAAPGISLFRVSARGLEFRARIAGVENTGPALEKMFRAK